MKIKIYIAGVVAFILMGCYEDKGNYDYKEVNDVVSLTFAPEPVITEYSYNYKYRQPLLDTLEVTYSPEVKQSNEEGESNLEFQWITKKTVDKKTVYDTLRSKELTLKYPPKKNTSYNPLFKMIDRSTGIEYYRQFSMKTRTPFVNSWFVLHGQPNDRKLGVVEDLDSLAVITDDVYENIWGVRRFQKAIGLVYSPQDALMNYATGIVEHLTILQADSSTYMHPFNLVAYKRIEQMILPGANNSPLVYGMGDETGGASVMVNENGKFFWARGFGYYYAAKTNEESKDYIVDKMYISGMGYMTVWDKTHKKFFYYNVNENYAPGYDSGTHPSDASANTAVLRTFEKSIFADKEWNTQEVIYLGQGVNEFEAGTTIVAVDTGTYSVYQVGYNVKGESSLISVKKQTAKGMNVNADSRITTSVAYQNQLFYSRDGVVYLYNVVNGEEIYLYDAGGPITQLKFRISRDYDSGYGALNANRRLAVVVNKTDGTGELHEIFLDIAGDVERVEKHTGFGAIQDIVYSAPGLSR